MERVWEMKSLSAPPQTKILSARPILVTQSLWANRGYEYECIRIAIVLYRVYVSGIMDDTDGARGDTYVSLATDKNHWMK